MTFDINDLIKKNQERWKSAKLATKFSAAALLWANRLIFSRQRYQEISDKTKVPWWIIGVIHVRESGQNWNCSLAQGDPWNEISIHDPKGRGPFSSWSDAAVDALENCSPYAAKWIDWSAGGALTLLEKYNGLGYAMGPFSRSANSYYPPQASPYVWSGTNQYQKGKYITDGNFDPDAVDKQTGCAAIILSGNFLNI